MVEVADSSLAYDRDTKILLYARHDIPEAWLVDVDGRRLIIYRQPEPERYREALDPAPLGPTPLSAPPDLAVDLTGAVLSG